MTIISTGNPSYVVINGSGATTYTFAFKAFPTESDPAIYSVNVWLQDGDGTIVQQVQGAGADYTVTTTSSSAEAGTITFKTAVPTTKKILIASAVPYTQPVDLSSSNAAITGPVLEKAFDRLEMQIRQLNRNISLSLHIEIPPEIYPINLLVDHVIKDGATVYWQRDEVQPNTFNLKTSDFTIDELKALVFSIEAAVNEVKGALTAAQTAANNAAASAQQVANSLTQLTSQIIQVIADLNATKAQVEGIKDIIQVLQTNVESIRDQVVAARDEVMDALSQITALTQRFPTPVGVAKNYTYVTNGQDGIVWKPYYPIEKMDSAVDGQVIATQTLPDGTKALIAQTPNSTSDKIATFNPTKEGGTSVSSALIGHEDRLNVLENRASIYPFGIEHVVADFIVNVDGNLRNSIDALVIDKEDPINIKYEYFDSSTAYWTTGNNFTIPPTISGKAIIAPQHSMLFGLYIDAANPDTVIFSNMQFNIKKTGTNLQFIVGAAIINVPITLNKWVFYCVVFGGNAGLNVTIYYGHLDAGALVTANAQGTITSVFTSEKVAVNLETNLRMVRLAFTDSVVSEDEFKTWVLAIYGLKASSSSYELPDPSGGTQGQVPTVVGGQYQLKDAVLIEPIATGWTVDSTLEIPANMAAGEHHLYFDVNATTKTAVLKEKIPVVIPNPTGTNGQAIVVNNGAYVLGNVPSFVNLPAGWTINDAIDVNANIKATGYYYMFLQADVIAKTLTVKVANMIPSTKPHVILYRDTPTPGTPQLLIAANPNAKNRLIQNNTSYDIIVGDKTQLDANIDQGWLIDSGRDMLTEINGALHVVFPVGATALPANVYIRITEEVIV